MTTGGRVLLIGGWGRCGSTLLDMMLGQTPNLVSAGEVRELWLRGVVENRPCGCSAAFHDCPFWTAVGDAAYGGWDQLDLETILRIRYSADRPWGIPRVLTHRVTGIETYTNAVSDLYRGIREVSGCEVIIDSSKLPSHTVIVASMPTVDARLVHLVRDSRGVAYSTAKRVEKRATAAPSTWLPQHGPVASAARYNLYNGLTTAVRRLGVRYLRLRYEDVVRAPAAALDAVLAHAGEERPADGYRFLHDHAVDLATNHLVDGNPVRFADSPLPLRADEEWRRQMSTASRWTVSALTSPLLLRYGYHRPAD